MTHAVALTPDMKRTLLAAAAALLPAIETGTAFERASVDELRAEVRFEEIFGHLAHERLAKDLTTLLKLLGTAAGGMLLYGKFRPFHKLSPGAAEDALRTMATSRLPQARQAFQAIKKLTSTAVLATGTERRRPIAWDAMGYPGPDGRPPETPKLIRLTPVTADTTIDCDVAVVGSGAGGGVAADVLAAAGLDVVVLEKGAYHNEADFTHYESEAYRDLYLDGLQESTKDLGVTMIAGSTLGGGTVVNYTTSFATPARVRQEWDDLSGLGGVFTGSEFEASSQAVHGRLNVNDDHNEPSSREAIMEKGLRNLGWHVEAMPRNVDGCETNECGYCTMGCRIGAKQSSMLTWLQDANERGARIIINADVRRILHEADHARGIEAEVDGHRLTVRARAVVLAAGSLNTPAIMLRSGLKGRAVGKYLRLHPATPMWGDFAEPHDPWTGIMQALYSDEFADLDGAGYGVKFETAPIHPLFLGVLVPWDSGRQFKRAIGRYRNMGLVGVLLRDKAEGRVTVDKRGLPVWSYRMADDDVKHMREGLMRAAQVLAEAGATEVMAPMATHAVWNPRGSEELAAYMRRLDGIGYGATQLLAGSWHQLGSCRMGVNPKTSVVDAENESHATKGLFILDASTFPSSSGVNPMMSIKTIAHRGARALAARLT